MKKLPVCFLSMMTVLAVSGCASGGGSHDNGDYIGPVYPASGMYYGSYDYNDYYPEYIVTPRPPVDASEGPDNRPGLHPEHPIANPPGSRLENRPRTGRQRCRQTGPRPGRDRHRCRSSEPAQRRFPRGHAPWVVVAGVVAGGGVNADFSLVKAQSEGFFFNHGGFD